jgi:hypothetical protein
MKRFGIALIVALAALTVVGNAPAPIRGYNEPAFTKPGTGTAADNTWWFSVSGVEQYCFTLMSGNTEVYDEGCYINSTGASQNIWVNNEPAALNSGQNYWIYVDRWISDGEGGWIYYPDTGYETKSTTIDTSTPGVAVWVNGTDEYATNPVLQIHIEYADAISPPWANNFVCTKAGAACTDADPFNYVPACSNPYPISNGQPNARGFDCPIDASSKPDSRIHVCAITADGAVPDNPNDTDQFVATGDQANLSGIACGWVTLDRAKPTTPSLTSPGARFQLQRNVAVAWSASTDATSGVAAYQVQTRKAPWNGVFGAWSLWKTVDDAVRSATFTGSLGNTHCFRVRAKDNAGNVSAWSAAKCTALPLDDPSLAATGTWSRGTGTGYYQGTFSRSTTGGSSLTKTGVNAKAVSVLVTKCPTCGSIKLYWAGGFLRQVSLVSTTIQKKQLVQIVSFTTPQTGSVKVTVAGSGKKVEIDGLAVSAG